MEARRHREDADRHEAAAVAHDELAAHWEAEGDPEQADLERRRAELERMAAQLARDRAAAEQPDAGSRDHERGAARSSPGRESEILKAVEILRGTTYDFRVEATIDVVALYGQEVLVAALEQLDAEIAPSSRDGIARPLPDAALTQRIADRQ